MTIDTFIKKNGGKNHIQNLALHILQKVNNLCH